MIYLVVAGLAAAQLLVLAYALHQLVAIVQPVLEYQRNEIRRLQAAVLADPLNPLPGVVYQHTPAAEGDDVIHLADRLEEERGDIRPFGL